MKIANFYVVALGILPAVFAVDAMVSKINFKDLKTKAYWTNRRKILAFICVFSLVMAYLSNDNNKVNEEPLEKVTKNEVVVEEYKLPQIISVKEFAKEVEQYAQEDIFVEIDSKSSTNIRVMLLVANSNGHYNLDSSQNIEMQLIDQYWKVLYTFKDIGTYRYQIWIVDDNGNYIKSEEYSTIVRQKAALSKKYEKIYNIDVGNQCDFSEIDTYIGLKEYNIVGDYGSHEVTIELANEDEQTVVVKPPYSKEFNYETKTYRLTIEDGYGYAIKATIREL